MRVAIIGAGLTGLTAARALRGAGVAVTVFDKSRGVGGRLSTRRADGGLQFDHGAQYLSPKSEGFAALLAEAQAAGAAKNWGEGRVIGARGMSGLAKFLASGVDVHRAEITELGRSDRGWQVADGTFDRVICTVPAPQACGILGPAHPLTAALTGVEMTPNLTLMLALPARENAFETARDAEEDIAWLALDSAKHGRDGPDCWVAQASLAFSLEHLELEKPAIADLMLPLVCARLGADPAQALYVAGHRWRYAQVSKPLGQSYLSDDTGLYIGGDWALTDRAEGAWASGVAMARAVLETR
ncbi:MAG: FAD-dependent oxidoreductase [Pseudomonadota bacterium]